MLADDFRETVGWHHTGVEAAARVRQLDNGNGELRIEVAPSSSEFKFFAEAHAAILVTGVTGAVVTQEVVHELAMAMGWAVSMASTTPASSTSSADRSAPSPAFFRLKFCAWHMGFDRTVKVHSGCFKSSIIREIRAFTRDMTSTIGALTVPVDERFELLSWHGIRVAND